MTAPTTRATRVIAEPATTVLEASELFSVLPRVFSRSMMASRSWARWAKLSARRRFRLSLSSWVRESTPSELWMWSAVICRKGHIISYLAMTVLRNGRSLNKIL